MVTLLAVTDPASVVGPDISPWIILLRLLIASVLGATIGLERRVHGREAGLRTMMLVSLGCCLVMLVSNAFVEVYWQYSSIASNFIRIDPARLAYSVMGGIGFLGAGAILKNDSHIRGLTTAATIWCVAAVGLAVGIGWYFVPVIVTAMVLFALLVLDRLENRMEKHWCKTIEVLLPDDPSAIERFISKIQQQSAEVLETSLERRSDGKIKATCNIRVKKHVSPVSFFNAIAHEPEVEYLQLQ